MPASKSSAAAAAADLPGDLNISERWSDTLEWLVKLKQLVDHQTSFNAIKLANYLEADLQLFHRMPELWSVGREARRLCRSHPRLSAQVAARVGQLQGTWLAIEAKLKEFGSQRTVFSALSGDLKLLESCNVVSSSNASLKDKHMCCIQKMALLDGKIQKKDGQLQQMLSVTSAMSKLLDLFSKSELLLNPVCEPGRSYRLSRADARRQGRQSASSSVSTTYQRTPTITDGDPTSSDSSDIVAEAGHMGVFNSASAVQNGNQNALLQPGENLASECSCIANLNTAEGRRDSPATWSFALSPVLQTVGTRIAGLKSSIQVLQASLESVDTASASSSGSAAQLDTVEVAQAALARWRAELAALRASVLSAAVSEEQEIFRHAYLESIKLLGNWSDSLSDRFSRFS